MSVSVLAGASGVGAKLVIPGKMPGLCAAGSPGQVAPGQGDVSPTVWNEVMVEVAKLP